MPRPRPCSISRRPGNRSISHSPTSIPFRCYYSTAGIFKDAPHPNVAKLYLTWVLAPEQQSRIGTFSPRNDVPPPAGLKPLFSYTVANDYRGFVTNERLLADLRQRFEAAVGPIRNAGGVR